MWSLAFAQAFGKETLGTLTATWNAGQPDEFVFVDSVNLDRSETTDNFVVQAKKALIVRDSTLAKKQSVQAATLSVLEAQLNK